MKYLLKKLLTEKIFLVIDIKLIYNNYVIHIQGGFFYAYIKHH